MNSPVALSLITILLWSFGGVAAKFFDVENGALLYISLIFAALVYYQLAQFCQKRKFYVPAAREICSRKGIISSLGFGFYWLLIAEAVRLAQNASIPFAIQYVWILSNAIFFELCFSANKSAKLSIAPFLFSIISFLGILLLASSSVLPQQDLLLIILFSVSSGLCFGYFSAYSSTLESDNHFEFLCLSGVTGIIVFAVWGLLTRQELGQLTLRQFIISFILGLLIDGVGSYLWTKANRLVRERSASIYSITILPLFLPFLSAFLLYLFFEEQNIFSGRFLTGLSLVLISSYLTKRFVSTH